MHPEIISYIRQATQTCIAIILVSGFAYMIYSNEKDREAKNAQFTNLQQYAISNHLARWEVIDSTGKTEFKWNVQTNNVER